MRRKKDDKRVLRAGNGRNTRNNRRGKKRSFRLRDNVNTNNPRSPNKQKKKRKRSGKTVFIMVLVLIAFIIGAGIGITLSFEKNDAQNETHVENVTVEMTTHLNETDQVIFDEEDDVDFNENQTDPVLRDENQVYYDYRYDDYNY